MADMTNETIKRDIYRECHCLGLSDYVRERLIKAVNLGGRMVPATQYFDDAVDSVMNDLKSVMIDRQRKYGHRNIMEFGEMGILVRASDKLARLKNYYIDKQGQGVEDESLDDTWIDLANYAILSLMVRNGIFERPLRDNDTSKDSA